MAIHPTPPGLKPTPGPRIDPNDPMFSNPNDQMRGNPMNPYGRTGGTMKLYWMVGAIVIITLVIGFFFMRQQPTIQPMTSHTTEDTVPTQPVPVTPTQPEPTQP